LAFIKNCGIMVEPQEGMAVKELLDIAKSVEKEGYGYFFRSDHLLPTTRRTNLDSPECWVSLGAIAAHTKKIKFGSMVSPIGFRNPALLARMACTVDSISSGRLQLGMGAGWYEDEYLAHGFEFPSVKVRKEQFHEALQIIRPLTQTGRVDFEGRYFSAHLDGLPKLDRKIHMIIGGRAPSIVRETLKYADEWNFFAAQPPEFESLKKALAASKRRINISQMGPFIVAGDKRGLRTRVRAEMRRQGISKDEDVFTRELTTKGWLIATSGDFAQKVNQRREIGIEKIYFQIWETKDSEPVELLAGILKNL
jgi:alkanesulfonate monooxygenase SsuD/methylene tetrahydromethanopterin reductase-like flavin-dependent oxidoreductase (luciferase family)